MCTIYLMPLLSYAKGLETPRMKLTLAGALARTSEYFPEREALISRHQNLRCTWREFDVAVSRVARGLVGLGLCAQDRVGIWSTNCAEWVLLQYGWARAGIVLVNVNPAYRPYELSYVLTKSRMRALFLWERDARSNYQQILELARSPKDALEHVIHLGTSEWDGMLSEARIFRQSQYPPMLQRTFSTPPARQARRRESYSTIRDY